MQADQNIINELIGLEAMASTLMKNAAMLRQRLQRGGLSATSPKGKNNVEITNKAKSFYNKRIIKSSSSNQKQNAKS